MGGKRVGWEGKIKIQIQGTGVIPRAKKTPYEKVLRTDKAKGQWVMKSTGKNEQD